MNVKEKARRPRGLRKIAEAADFFGVMAGSLWSWDRHRRLVPDRNPNTGYRDSRRDPWEVLLKQAIAQREADA